MIGSVGLREPAFGVEFCGSSTNGSGNRLRKGGLGNGVERNQHQEDLDPRCEALIPTRLPLMHASVVRVAKNPAVLAAT